MTMIECVVVAAVVAIIGALIWGVYTGAIESGPPDGEVGYYSTEMRWDFNIKQMVSERVWHPVEAK